LMTGAEETPPINTPVTANSMTIVRVNRDPTGNITSGSVTFNAAYSAGGPVSFTGWHIHNAKFGAPGSVLINTQISAGSPITDQDGTGSASRDVTIDGTNPAVLNALKGVIASPDLYYVNLHTLTNPNGIIRAQLTRETYHYKTSMDAANEFPV